MTKEFIEKYDKLAQELGVNNIIRLIPFSRGQKYSRERISRIERKID